MPDIPNRDELERKLARLLGKYNRQQLAEIMALMGNSPDMAKIPLSFWAEADKELAKALIPFSEMVYLAAAERMLETVPIGVDWALINEGAANWARDYAYGLIKEIGDNTRRALQGLISDFFERGWTIGDLTDRLTPLFGPIRAEMIAQSEITRAAAAGEYGLVAEIMKEGVQMVAVWQTSNDDIVCPICEPRHGRKEGDGWHRNAGKYQEPPAHPRCRCWVNHEFAKEPKRA